LQNGEAILGERTAELLRGDVARLITAAALGGAAPHSEAGCTVCYA
jgi:hypothetical protein